MDAAETIGALVVGELEGEVEEVEDAEFSVFEPEGSLLLDDVLLSDEGDDREEGELVVSAEVVESGSLWGLLGSNPFTVPEIPWMLKRPE
ncbi:hypothetical protein G9A89_023969 [Geosiphon pyriformis]|nr:hypothetical protein G9A89_023969 [Geosiphon pyriformis]